MAYRRSLLSRATLLTRHRLSAAPLSSDHRQHPPLTPPFPAAVNTYIHTYTNILTPSPFHFSRNISTDARENPEAFADVADKAADVAAAAGGISEVAAAAADSAYPVAALQYFIEGVHNLTGFNWWASIVLTTLLIRGATVPLLINQLKASTKLGLLRPELEAIKDEMQDKFNMQEGMEGNPAAQTMKKVSRVFAAVTIPITMNFPKALFCYWVTSNLFSLMYGAVLKAPGVKQFLNIPEIPVAPPSTTTNSGKPQFSFLESMKKYVAAQEHIHAQQTAEVLSQRVKGLESQVKSKNKNKKT